MTKKPFFQKLVRLLLALTVLQILIFLCAVFSQRVVGRLKDNEKEVISEKVISRKVDVENQMLNNWSNLQIEVDKINAETAELLERENVSAEALVKDSARTSTLLQKVTPMLVDMMQFNRTTGAYLILNTDDLSADMQNQTFHSKQGVYLKNVDPNAQSVNRAGNVLVARSPISVAQNLDLAMNPNWDVNFDFARDELPYYDWFYRPFQMAYETETTHHYSWRDYGCWNAPCRLDDGSEEALTYSVPLILEDGTVYGVMGVEISLEYFQSMLNSMEMPGNGTFFLGVYSKEQDQFHSLFGYAESDWILDGEDGWSNPDRDDYFVTTSELYLYENNTPFSGDTWVVGGAANYRYLYRLVQKFVVILFAAAALTLILGILGSFLITYVIQKPIADVVGELRSADPREPVVIAPTGITEIDAMTEAVQRLSRNVIESSNSFHMILQMASIGIAGFQMNRKAESLYISHGFFALFGQADIETRDMTIELFDQQIEQLQKYRVNSELLAEGDLYCVSIEGRDRYIQLKLNADGDQIYGLAEDVTKVLLERRVLTHQRDHDYLTNLYNRGAFRRKLSQLFNEQTDAIKVGAFIMVDLDNLKYINDTYGHDYGDRYIRSAATAIRKGVSGGGYYSRISGDEFNIFLYGYETREALIAQIEELRTRVNESFITLPGGKIQRLHASGGVAWYPYDSTEMDELGKYADYAMYMVKKSHKGDIGYFDKATYLSQNVQRKHSAALNQIIEHQEVHYALQPIVDAHTAAVFGYEALMRSDNRELSHVGEILDTARLDGKLNQIETMTWNMALARYAELIETGKIAPEAKIFVNSIPNQQMKYEATVEMVQRFKKYFHQVVLELTEEEKLSGEALEHKKLTLSRHGAGIALDDYGSGYNGEQTLLVVNPDYIKIDIEIIRDIDRNPDKYDLMEYMVNFAHQRGKFVIAEGIETVEELQTVIQIGADYLQGYFLAKPEVMPAEISETAKRVILESNHT